MRTKKRIRTLLLALCFVAGMLPRTAFATEGGAAIGTGGLCEHHPEHDDTCGYAEAEGQDCKNVCAECCTCGAGEDGEHIEGCSLYVSCTCESDDPAYHAPFCDTFVRSESPVCDCAEPCAEDAPNDWCEVCYFNGAEACEGVGASEPYDGGSGVYVGGTELIVGTYYKTIDGAITSGGESDYNVHLVKEDSTYKLTLNNAEIKGINDSQYLGAGIYYNGNAGGSMPLEIVLSGENSVNSHIFNSSTGWTAAIAVEYASLTISGDGSLEAHAKAPDNDSANCAGIYVTTDSFTMESGTVIASATGGDTYASAIFANVITINGGTVYANCSLNGSGEIAFMGGGANVDVSAGLYGNGNDKNIVINGGTVYAYGGEAASSSSGIYSSGNISCTDGDIYAYGGSAGDGSCAIGALYNVSIGGDVSIKAKCEEDAPIIYGIGGEKVTIDGNAAIEVSISGEATGGGVGGDTDGDNIAIGAEGKLTIGGAATVTAASGKGAKDSFALGADEIEVTGGTINGTSGDAGHWSVAMGATTAINVTGGTQQLTGGDAEDYSAGLGSQSDITIDGGNVRAEGNDAGIYAGGSIQIDMDGNRVIYGVDGDGSMDRLEAPSAISSYKTIYLGESYTVTYHSNYPDDGDDSDTKSIMSIPTEPLTLPSYEEVGFTAPDLYGFAGWAEGSPTNASLLMSGNEFKVTKDVDFYAVWKQEKYRVNVTATGGGSAGGFGDYDSGDTVRLEAEPDEGYYFVKWDVIAGDVDLDDPMAAVTTFTMPEEYVWVKAVFEALASDPYSITIELTGNGSGTAWADKEAAVPGETITLTAKAAEGSEFKGWTFPESIALSSSELDLEIDFIMPGQDVTISAEFSPLEYLVTIEGGGSGASVNGKYEKGAAVEIYAGTRSGYRFTGWTSDDVTLTNASDATASFEMPAKDVTVTANWEKISSVNIDSSDSSGSSDSDDDGGSTTTPAQSNELDDVPDTGDDSRMGLWILLMMSAAAGIVVCIIVQRRSRTN